MCHGGVERREHKVTDAEKGEASGGGWSLRGTQNEEHDLNNVVVSLEIVQRGVATQGLYNDV